jgi:hypothetical protein
MSVWVLIDSRALQGSICTELVQRLSEYSPSLSRAVAAEVRSRPPGWVWKPCIMQLLSALRTVPVEMQAHDVAEETCCCTQGVKPYAFSGDNLLICRWTV